MEDDGTHLMAVVDDVSGAYLLPVGERWVFYSPHTDALQVSFTRRSE